LKARRIQIVGALFLTVLSVPSLCSYSSPTPGRSLRPILSSRNCWATCPMSYSGRNFGK